MNPNILLPPSQQPLLVIILSQINPFRVPPSIFFKINVNTCSYLCLSFQGNSFLQAS